MRKKVKPEEIMPNENMVFVKGTNKFRTGLYHNLYVPSYVHGYSLAIEYMKRWFLEGLSDINFKYIHINGKHMFDDFKQFNNMNIKREKPLVIITPNIDHDYDRENLDLYTLPDSVARSPIGLNRSFFQDRDNNLFLGIQMKNLRIRFTFAVRVSTKAEQLDIKERMALRYRVGATQGEYRVVDYVVSSDIMNNIAYDAGFEIKEYNRCNYNTIYNDTVKYYVKNGNEYREIKFSSKNEFLDNISNGVYVRCEPEILEPTKFLEYLNRHSAIPFTYKMRGIKNKPEFYIRMDKIYCHINTKDRLSLDDGEREGQLENNFHVSMEAELDMPVPHFFVYYVTSPIRYNITTHDRTTKAGFYTIAQMNVPLSNQYGWESLITTEYLCEPNEIEIDCTNLFYKTRLLIVIENCIRKGISPDCFIELKIFIDIAGQIREVPCRFDYKNIKIYLQESYKQEQMIYLSFYVDTVYMYNELENIERINDERI